MWGKGQGWCQETPERIVKLFVGKVSQGIPGTEGLNLLSWGNLQIVDLYGVRGYIGS